MNSSLFIEEISALPASVGEIRRERGAKWPRGDCFRQRVGLEMEKRKQQRPSR